MEKGHRRIAFLKGKADLTISMAYEGYFERDEGFGGSRSFTLQSCD